MAPAISIENLSFTYRLSDQPSLRNINAEMEEGSFVVIMGQSGAGKSTLCSTFNALVPRFFSGNYQGRVMIKGVDVALHSVAQMSRSVGLVLQDFEAQLFSTNVELEMAFGPENHSLSRQEIERRINHYLAFVGLENFRRREPATLSGGQKQRLAIGSVLAMEPELLVMDEPTTDLDPVGREEILAVAEKIREENRMLIIVDQEPETAAMADQVWLMKEGRLIAQGSPNETLVDLPLLESCGIKPPSLLALFSSMGWPEAPLALESAISIIEKKHLVQQQKRLSRSTNFLTASDLLRAERLRYTYPGGYEALQGVDLSIGEGEFIALLGQNGSGKTTLAKHFNGLLKPTSGRMLIQGKSTTELSHRQLARQVGYVFQNPDHQIFARTVREEVGFGLKVMGEDPKTIERRVEEALETVGLQGYEEKVPFALSKGERQRVAVASILTVQPGVIVLDEPTTGLDYAHQRKMMEMLERLNQKGHTVIIITHSMWVAAEYTRRTIVMKDGQIMLDGPTREVFANEKRLTEASLCPPLLVRLSNWLGTQALTVEDMVKELKGRG